jgi:hypothetical protein
VWGFDGEGIPFDKVHRPHNAIERCKHDSAIVLIINCLIVINRFLLTISHSHSYN